MTRKCQIQIKNYQIFEVVRENTKGGSILTAVHENLGTGGPSENYIYCVVIVPLS